MELWNLANIALTAFVVAIMGLAAKQLWPQIKAQPIAWTAMIVAVGAAIFGLRLMTADSDVLEPPNQNAVAAQVQYAMYRAHAVSAVFFAASMSMIGALGFLLSSAHRELRLLHRDLAKSAQNRARSDIAANTTP